MGIISDLDISNEFKNISLMKRRIDVELTDRGDIERAYEGMFLYLVTKFENFLEEIFIGVLIGNISIDKKSIIKKNSLIKISHKNSKEDIINFLIGEKNNSTYIDWLPYTKTEERAKKFFKKGYPFAVCNDEKALKKYNYLLTLSNKQILLTISKIRNYIAHKSTDSYDKLKKDISTYKDIHDLFNRKHTGSYIYFDYLILELNSICLKIQANLK